MPAEMTKEQAVSQAAQLHRQGKTWPEIEEHFKKIGYKSPKTGKAIGHLAIRHMVKTAELKGKKQAKKDVEEDVRDMHVSGPSLRDMVKEISSLKVDDTMFAHLLKALLAKYDSNGAAK
jgi:hypothetical protein